MFWHCLHSKKKPTLSWWLFCAVSRWISSFQVELVCYKALAIKCIYFDHWSVLNLYLCINCFSCPVDAIQIKQADNYTRQLIKFEVWVLCCWMTPSPSKEYNSINFHRPPQPANPHDNISLIVGVWHDQFRDVHHRDINMEHFPIVNWQNKYRCNIHRWSRNRSYV